MHLNLSYNSFHWYGSIFFGYLCLILQMIQLTRLFIFNYYLVLYNTNKLNFSTMKHKIKKIFIIVIALLVISVLIDLIRINNYEVYPSRPNSKNPTEIYKIYYELVDNTKQIDWKRLDRTLDFINGQYDCADFRLATLVRILYDFNETIPDSVLPKIESTLLNFRYWMDEPGENGMCYWSENHQILFASSEYLVGQLYTDSIFSNTGLTGREHMEKAKVMILDWLEMKWKYGFTEFYSNIYYSEDIGGMINLIDYANNEEIVKKTKIIMDLLLYDVASQKSGNMFNSVSGRAYEKSRKGDSNASFYNITNHIWPTSSVPKPHLNYGFIASKNYEVPQVIKEIGYDKNSVIIKQSNGLNLSELKSEGYFGTDNRSIMMQWGMEAFTNKEIIRNSVDYIRENNMFTNEFLHAFKDLDYTAIRLFHLEPFISNIIKAQSDGNAIQRANTYTYRTNNYSIYTVQNHFPDMYGIQHHISGMNLGDSFAVFHLHPATPDSIKLHSPNYWVGYGRLPQAVQDKNVSLSIYNLPEEKNMMEMHMLNFTHAYFPTELFDSTYLVDNYAFGKKGSAYTALIGKNELNMKDGSSDDLIQLGRKTFWIIEAGSINEDGSFKDFYSRILNNLVEFDDDKLVLKYTSQNRNLTLTYNSKFMVNGKSINTEYDRFDSPYIKAKRKADKMEFRFNGKYLSLDFENLVRENN